MLWKVISDHKAIYPDPISVKLGDRITLSGREDDWDGHRWLWAIADNRREGWVPDDLPIEVSGKNAQCAYDYSAAEISVGPGQTLTGSLERHGWLWCQNDKGIAGWVPLKCLSKINKYNKIK